MPLASCWKGLTKVGFYEVDVDGEDVRGDVAVHRALMGLEDRGHSTQAALCHDAAAPQRFKVCYTVTMPKTTKPIPSELQRRSAFNVLHSLTSWASFCLESRASFHTCLQRGGYGKPPYGVPRQEVG